MQPHGELWAAATGRLGRVSVRASGGVGGDASRFSLLLLAAAEGLIQPCRRPRDGGTECRDITRFCGRRYAITIQRTRLYLYDDAVLLVFQARYTPLPGLLAAVRAEELHQGALTRTESLKLVPTPPVPTDGNAKACVA